MAYLDRFLLIPLFLVGYKTLSQHYSFLTKFLDLSECFGYGTDFKHLGFC